MKFQTLDQYERFFIHDGFPSLDLISVSSNYLSLLKTLNQEVNNNIVKIQ